MDQAAIKPFPDRPRGLSDLDGDVGNGQEALLPFFR